MKAKQVFRFGFIECLIEHMADLLQRPRKVIPLISASQCLANMPKQKSNNRLD